MTVIALAISLTALLFAISGFVLGLLAFIQVRASAQATHTVQQIEARPQADLSDYFGSSDKSIAEEFSIPTKDLEAQLLQGFE